MPDFLKKIQIEGLGEVEVSKEGIQAMAEKMTKSMKDSHDQAVGKGNELATTKTELEEKVAKIAELEQQITSFTNSTDLGLLSDEDYVQAKDVKKIVSAIRSEVKKELQETQGALQNLNASVIENQVALIKAKRPDATNEEIQKAVAIQKTFKPELMKSMLIQMGHTNVQSVSPEDMALYIYDGIQKGFVSGDGGTTGIQKQGVREGKTTTDRKEFADEMHELGFSDSDIVNAKAHIRETGMSEKEYIERMKGQTGEHKGQIDKG